MRAQCVGGPLDGMLVPIHTREQIFHQPLIYSDGRVVVILHHYTLRVHINATGDGFAGEFVHSGIEGPVRQEDDDTTGGVNIAVE
jgi:hypothetical protein